MTTTDPRAQWRAAWGMARRMVRGRRQGSIETRGAVFLDRPRCPPDADERLALFTSHALRRGLPLRMVQEAGRVAYEQRLPVADTEIVGWLWRRGRKIPVFKTPWTFDPLMARHVNANRRAWEARQRRDGRLREAA